MLDSDFFQFGVVTFTAAGAPKLLHERHLVGNLLVAQRNAVNTKKKKNETKTCTLMEGLANKQVNSERPAVNRQPIIHT